MRPAHISPSQFHKVMTNGRGKDSFGKTAETYAWELARRHCGFPIDQYTSYDMQRGIDLEPDAVREYERKNMVEVYGKERKVHPKYDFISGETDGLVGKDGMIEVKSPNASNHFDNLMDGKQLNDYKWQIQGYLWIENRKWCDFVSFNPDYPDGFKLAVYMVDRDDEMIAELESRCVRFWDELVLPKIEQIENLND